MPETEISTKDAMTRVIHLLNKAGDVVAIGWEPAASVIDRQKAFNQTNQVIRRVSELLSMMHSRRIPPEQGSGYRGALDDVLCSPEATNLVDAIADLRALMPAAARGTEKGLGFAWPTDEPFRFRKSA